MRTRLMQIELDSLLPHQQEVYRASDIHISLRFLSRGLLLRFYMLRSRVCKLYPGSLDTFCGIVLGRYDTQR